MNVIPMKSPNDDNIMLRGFQIELKNDVGRQFVRDCARNIEGLISDGDIMLKYGLSPKDWGDIRTNQALLRAIQAEHNRRVLNNIQLQEGSAKILSDAPRILGDILNNDLSNPDTKSKHSRYLGKQPWPARGAVPERKENCSRSASMWVKKVIPQTYFLSSTPPKRGVAAITMKVENCDG